MKLGRPGMGLAARDWGGSVGTITFILGWPTRLGGARVAGDVAGGVRGWWRGLSCDGSLGQGCWAVRRGSGGSYSYILMNWWCGMSGRWCRGCSKFKHGGPDSWLACFFLHCVLVVRVVLVCEIWKKNGGHGMVLNFVHVHAMFL